MNNTKETIGPRETVAGFRPLIRKERWHEDSFTAEMLEGGWRPLLDGESIAVGDQWHTGMTWLNGEHFNSIAVQKSSKHRTKRPLPQPQVETFEAHGHVWYRHVPGDACPVDEITMVDCLIAYELKPGNSYVPCLTRASKWVWDRDDEVIGYRFPDFQAVHTPLQQQQPCAQPVEKTMQSFQHEQPDVQQQFRTKKRLLDMYHGWCDVAPDSVAEFIADVARVLYPTDADRCDAAFQKWWSNVAEQGMEPSQHKHVWESAWNAAKQEKL